MRKREMEHKIFHLEAKTERLETEINRFSRLWPRTNNYTSGQNYMNICEAVQVILDHLSLEVVHTPEKVEIKETENEAIGEVKKD